jgi:hypothetical protein
LIPIWPQGRRTPTRHRRTSAGMRVKPPCGKLKIGSG